MTESLLILAKTQQQLFPGHHQVNQSKVLNYLLLSVETALVCKSYSLAKRILLSLYEQVQPLLLQYKPYPLMFNQVFQKAFILLCEIPN